MRRKCEIHCGAFVGRDMNIMGDFWRDFRFPRKTELSAVRYQFRARARDFSILQSLHTSSVVHPAYYSVITGDLILTGFKNYYNFTPSCPYRH